MMNLFITNTLHWRVDTCGLLCCFYRLFWRHPFTVDDSLVNKWCNAEFLQICSNEETNSSISWMRLSKFSENVYFWVNYSFVVTFTFVWRNAFSIRIHKIRNFVLGIDEKCPHVNFTSDLNFLHMKFTAYTSIKLLDLEVTSEQAVLHTSLHYWQWTFFANKTYDL